MSRLSLDNDLNFCDPKDLSDLEIGPYWDALVEMMDDDIRERVHYELAPCTDEDFLRRYLELAKEDLILG